MPEPPSDPALADLINRAQTVTVPASEGVGTGRRIVTWVGNTAAVIYDVIQATNTAGVLAPLQLTGLVSRVDLMGQDEATGAAITSRQAVIDETSDSATYGQIHVTPDPSDIATPRNVVAWWRITYLDSSVIDTPEFEWVIQPHGVAPAGPDTPTGVCQAWATNEDIAAYTPLAVDEDFTPWLVEASELLYILSARQFPGACTDTVRPTSNTCGCWQALSRGHVVMPDVQWVGGMWWAESDAWQAPGCGMLRVARLAGHATRINEVRISGSVVDPSTYRLDDNEWLVRLTDPATGENPGWPACQDLSLPARAAGTFEIDYTWGRTPPIAGVRAAATLAWQLWLNDNPRGKDKCKLPAGWTSISRQGITITRPQIQKLATDGTGIVGIDAFLSSANPNGLDREPAVYSRDVMPYAQRVGP